MHEVTKVGRIHGVIAEVSSLVAERHGVGRLHEYLWTATIVTAVEVMRVFFSYTRVHFFSSRVEYSHECNGVLHTARGLHITLIAISRE